MKLKLVATCLFGLERLLGEEIEALGYDRLETADGRFGMIDTEGNIVLPFTYDQISMVSSGLVAVYRAENGWSVLKLMEKNN